MTDSASLTQETATSEVDKSSLKPVTNSFLDLKIKDTRYGWVVVFSMFISNIMTVGYVKAFGVIYNAILDVYPDATGTMAGLMVGLLAGFRCIFSPVAGMLTNLIGVRRTMLLGTFIYCASLFASFFCTTVAQLCVTLGALVGLSHCLIENSHVILLPQYFDSKLSFANGIRTSGNPVGGMIYPLIVTFLFNFYGLKSLFLILSGITAHIFICVFLVRPVEVHTKIKVVDKMKWILKSDPRIRDKNLEISSSKTGAELMPLSVTENNNDYNAEAYGSLCMHKSKLELYREIMDHNVDISDRKGKKKPLDLNYLRNPHFLLFVALAIGIPMGFPLALYYIILYAKESAGLPPYEIAFLLAFQAGLDFVLRISIGWFNNKNLYRKSRGFMICLWISAVGVALTPFSKSMWSLTIAVLLYSFGPASFQCFTNIILCEEFGRENIASTWGFFRMSQGICSFIHSVIIGYILDRSSSYVAPFLIMSFGLIICGFMMGIETIFKNYVTKAARQIVTCTPNMVYDEMSPLIKDLKFTSSQMEHSTRRSND